MRFNPEHFSGYEGFVTALTAGSLPVFCHFPLLRLCCALTLLSFGENDYIEISALVSRHQDPFPKGFSGPVRCWWKCVMSGLLLYLYSNKMSSNFQTTFNFSWLLTGLG